MLYYIKRQLYTQDFSLGIYTFFTISMYISLKNQCTSLNDLRSFVLDDFPFIELETIDFARDFELPGLPTKKRGILRSMQIAIMKTFSLRAAFRAMFLPNSMLFSRTF